MFADLSNINKTCALVLSKRCQEGVCTCVSCNSLASVPCDASVRRTVVVGISAAEKVYSTLVTPTLRAVYLLRSGQFFYEVANIVGEINARNRQKNGRKIVLFAAQ